MMGPLLRRHMIGGSPVRPGYWFAQKRFGFGSVPATVMGWAVTAAFLLILGLTIRAMPTDGARIVIGIAIMLSYLAIVWLKTDGGWRWRWGGE